MRISELAESAGVPTSTVRYYERVGLLAAPHRTSSGYRDYQEDAAARLLFIARARRMGLSCEQLSSLATSSAASTRSPSSHAVSASTTKRRAPGTLAGSAASSTCNRRRAPSMG